MPQLALPRKIFITTLDQSIFLPRLAEECPAHPWTILASSEFMPRYKVNVGNEVCNGHEDFAVTLSDGMVLLI